MSTQRGALPTLTEVIEIEADALAPAGPLAPLAPESVPLESQPPPAFDKAALTTQVLETLRPRLDGLLEARLQTALAPQLSRLTDELTQALRAELSVALQALVAQAVDEILARRNKA
ncbi:MAG: hypothetical protein V4792_19390 [Pseudomonadota bacterium]